MFEFHVLWTKVETNKESTDMKPDWHLVNRFLL